MYGNAWQFHVYVPEYKSFLRVTVIIELPSDISMT